MSKTVKNQTDFLKVLCKASQKQCKGIIEDASEQLIYAICECILNCLKGNVPLSPAQKQKLKRYKTKLRSTADCKYPPAKRKLVLSQKGGFLSAVLKPVLQTLGEFFLK